MSQRWLLSLSSNLDDDARVQAALVALATLGPTALLTPVLREPAYDDALAHDYFHALATLDVDANRTELSAACKRIERELGRVQGAPRVAIDIDLLACEYGAGWMADPHALAKHEFEHAPTRRLMAAAGITIEQASARMDSPHGSP